MATTAERLKEHSKRMRTAGFVQITAWACPELVALLNNAKRPGECRGRTLERLILGEARERPAFWSEAERAEMTPGSGRKGRMRTRRRLAGLMERAAAIGASSTESAGESPQECTQESRNAGAEQ
ncbi:hypothetical protein [Burkholderia vietnamiensis]|uniref:hypothetical protein n=1 Tax=Burkholderia vietnamiensis TaxID=60552 RepID=UPI000A7E68B4|nr:hypothetical protein [Burkholderia vietnamiensis]MCA7985361.1 hypothetical protein [Burkholderia vietnamiensis]HDR8932816.1 hypothetical protein [Burkholderia vietnamiensis]